MTAYVVQTVQNTGTTTTLAGTFPAAVRTGNCVVVVASSTGASNNGSVSAVTLAGVADNFTQLYTAGGTTTAAFLAWWADPSCTGGGTVVSVTWGGIAGNDRTSLTALEVGALFPSPAYLLGSGTQNSSGTAIAAWTSGTLNPVTAAPELWVGAVTATGPGTITGPTYPWINIAPAGSGTLTVPGYVAAPQPGTAWYSGTFSSASAYTAGIVALRGLPAASPSLPSYNAGTGWQQGDMNTVFTSPLGFFQQRTIFRATQTTTTTSFATGTPGAASTIAFDTVLEDPYQGWNTGTFAWLAPLTGWYQVTSTISVGNAAANTTLTMEIISPAQTGGNAGLIMSTTGGAIQGTSYVFLIAGQDSVSVEAFQVGGSNLSTVNSPPSSVEITWVSAAA